MILGDIEGVVKLHEMTMKLTGFSKVGYPLIYGFYEQLLGNPSDHSQLVAVHEGRIVGVITACEDLGKTIQVLRHAFTLRILIKIIVLIFMGKISLREIYNRIFFDFYLFRRFKSPYRSVLTLFVNENYQNRGIAKRLFFQLLKQQKNKHATLYVDTLKDNERAQAFYKSIGFSEIARITDSVVFRYDSKT